MIPKVSLDGDVAMGRDVDGFGYGVDGGFNDDSAAAPYWTTAAFAENDVSGGAASGGYKNYATI